MKVRCYVQLLETKLNNEIGDCLGTFSVRYLDGRLNLISMMTIADKFLEQERNTSKNKRICGYEIRKGDFTNYQVLSKHFPK